MEDYDAMILTMPQNSKLRSEDHVQKIMKTTMHRYIDWCSKQIHVPIIDQLQRMAKENHN